MHYVTFEINETQRTQRTQPTQPATVHWGVTDGQTFWALDGVSGFSTLLEMIEQGESAQAAIRMLAERAMSGALTVPTFTLAAVTLKAPYIPRYPIVCVGKNYADHAKELAAGGVMPDLPVPIFFTKAPYTVIGPWEEIDPHLGITEALDYEGEIAVIIGKEGRNIRPEEAMDYIFGYALLNDVTARDLQKAHQQYFKGKSLDTFAPWGPWITSAEHIEDLEAL
ncbi:MAG: fumarylacetoacetate hydrolase family protein, partial [Candidatus Carbobacillus sp.]|nr:fumarylacetoacetate hydrolase family protein [Candidatus Carbobacillus sp.]